MSMISQNGQTSLIRNDFFSLSAKMKAAFALRSLALFAILYQLRLIAADLSDTPVFIAALAAAFLCAVFLAGPLPGGRTHTERRAWRARYAGPLAAITIIGLAPWIARAFAALPRLFIPAETGALAISLDSLLLNIDRNNFVSLFPFYWAAVTGWFSIRSRSLLRAAVVADAVLLVVVFSIVRTADIGIYRFPVVLVSLFAGIVFVQVLALLFSLPPETRLGKFEALAAVAALLVLIIFGGALFLRPLQERAVEKGGGLLEPKLFSFDFSQFLRLDSEISMNDDLVLIVKKDSADEHILLRRSVLSGYSRKQGFYRIEELDEKTHPQKLPDRPVVLAERHIHSGDSSPSAAATGAAIVDAYAGTERQVKQEYFLVNFDASAFIGMNEPVSVIPYEKWDASSFSSAYAVESLVSDALLHELSQSAVLWPGAAELGLSEKEYKIYTDYGGEEHIRSFAEEITRGLDRYGDKVRMILNFLKYGDYRYSLKPGIAPDGDQLGLFLFQSKKGYCTYYAFAMTLMLRSLGIPARVAAGFFIDPSTNTFDYYPVRSDMAHAWVEVPFPGHGWIEYDPTSEDLAEGEEFRFSQGVDPNLFERLMREILENRSRLREKTGQGPEEAPSGMDTFVRTAAALLRAYSPLFLPVVIILVFLYIRCGCLFGSVMRHVNRKQTVFLWKHAKRRLALAGYRKGTASESEWAQSMDACIKGSYALYLCAAAARFAPEYTENDFLSCQNIYRDFSAAYKKTVSLRRRMLAWVLPPLALVLGPGKSSGVALLLILFVIAGSRTTAQDTDLPLPGDDTGHTFSAADELYQDASDAVFAEFWERAIELFNEGNSRYPDDPRFPWALGNLYYSRSLYGLAWEQYRKAEMLVPFETAILYRLANTAGYLNRDQTSVEYYEKVLVIEPDDKEAIRSLGWMYYKVHRLKEGERILVDALERFGPDADLAMTLGTVYSDLYRYDDGKFWYQEAIALGETQGDRLFTAVAWYNLSILESRFYKFNLSMDATNASLNALSRASGRLARGELYLRQLETEPARKDYEAAYETDTSPLAKLNLAQVYQTSGRLEEARLYAEDCLAGSDLSWMIHFGIDPDRYKRDIHDILYKTYKGLSLTERFIVWGRTGEKIRSFFRGISFCFRAAVHHKLYQKYSLASADAYHGETYESGGPHVESLVQYYNAFETYPRRAAAYLNRARDVESAVIPAAAPSYYLEEGLLTHNRKMLEQALAGLDPLWERELISRCYGEFARRGGAREEAESAAAELFAMNRGAPRQGGIALPVEINLVFGGENAAHLSKSGKALQRDLAKTGFTKPRGKARFSLSINISGSAVGGYTASCELVDAEGTVQALHHSIPLRSLSTADRADFARALGNAVFRAE